MKKVFFLLLSLILIRSHSVSAQDSLLQKKQFRIAVFAPLYLDSAFDGNNNYRYEDAFPKFINPGLEFYEGIQMALDSLDSIGIPVEVFVYDTRSATQNLATQLIDAVGHHVELLIAHITGQELFQFARIAKENAIPLIDVNLPNDGGITGNPYFVILNSTLRTHCEEIYKYLQKYHSTDQMIVFRRKGKMEDMIQSYFDEYAKTTLSVPLRLKYIDLPADFKTNTLTNYLDSNRKTVCIAASLDTAFRTSLTRKLATLSESYHPLVIGMPTWDNIDFTDPALKGLEIVYSTPFYNSRTDKFSTAIVEKFNREKYANPSDMVVRGYETMWKFANLLVKYQSDIASNIANKEFNLIRSFDIQPVLNKTSLTLDYFENRKLYFVKWADGLVKEVN
ncbi:MAG: hypothetical protein GC171_00550 [Terrimonas sp.]|nr:hypothetical protein [Terrimonas sp.]